MFLNCQAGRQARIQNAASANVKTQLQNIEVKVVFKVCEKIFEKDFNSKRTCTTSFRVQTLTEESSEVEH